MRARDALWMGRILGAGELILAPWFESLDKLQAELDIVILINTCMY